MVPSRQAANLKPPDTLPCPGKEACADIPCLDIIKRLKVRLCLHTFRHANELHSVHALMHKAYLMTSVNDVVAQPVMPNGLIEAYVTLQIESVSESLMFGWPHILVPHAASFDSMSEMQANEQSLLALCQVHSSCIKAQHTQHGLLQCHTSSYLTSTDGT